MVTATPAVNTGQSSIKDSGKQAKVPFRQATIERTEILPSDTPTVTAGSQTILNQVQGTGFLYGLWLQVTAVAAGNAAVVAYNEDAPWCAISQAVLQDVTGQVVNVNGFALYIANLVNRNYGNNFIDASADPVIYNLAAGGGATDGSFAFGIRIPVGINRRDLMGILGNQDRAQVYSLNNDLAASATIYSTAPTTLPGVTIAKTYESYTVPAPSGPSGPQEQLPPTYGTLHVLTGALSPSAPVGGAMVTHYLQRIGNTIRWIGLIFRSNGTRANADANRPTQITLKIGDQTIFNESYTYRRALMFQRFGFDLPNGVLVYDNIHDFGDAAGSEMGDDYYHTGAVQSAQFDVTYPAGFGSTNNTLEILTDDLQMRKAA